MRALLLIVIALVAGCKKDKKAASSSSSSTTGAADPVSTADLDALWALAPDGVKAGFVVSPAGMARLESGAIEIKKLFATAPELAPLYAKFEAELKKNLGTTNVSLAEVGMSRDKGFAMFGTEAGEVVIMPVVDRDKFLALAKGQKGSDSDMLDGQTCKTVQNVYACAKDPSLLTRLGKGNLSDTLKLAGARGDIEFAGTLPSPKLTITVAVVAQLQRGSFTLRGAVKGIPEVFASKLRATAKPRVDVKSTSGFGVANVAGLLGDVPPNLPIAPGLTLDELAKSLVGPIMISIPAGSIAFDVRVPLTDPAPAKKLVEQCDAIPPLKMMGATVTNGVCHVAVPQLMLELDAWIEGKELRVGKKSGQVATVSAPLGPAAVELANTEWAFAFFGRGTMHGATQLPQMPMGDVPSEAMMAIRGISLLNAFGVGVRLDGDVLRFLVVARTAWANPDDVVAKILAITPEQIMKGQSADAAKAIAAAAPQSPFAADLAASYGGLMIGSGAVGVLAAVAIPAFMDYMKKSKKSEAALQLNKLGKNLKVSYITNAAFPNGTAPLTPAKSCCDFKPDNKCLDHAAWDHPIWKELDFAMDEPHLYRYSYESDGKTFTAKAVSDLDCDGNPATWLLEGKLDGNGGVTTAITSPPAGSY